MITHGSNRDCKLWNDFIKRLNSVNNSNQALVIQGDIEESNIIFFENNNLERYTDQQWTKRSRFNHNRLNILKLVQSDSSLNSAVAYCRSGLAMMRVHENGKDFDIVTMPHLMSKSQIANATHEEPEAAAPLGLAFLPFLPLIIKGAVVVTSLVVSVLATMAVTETIQASYINDQAKIKKQTTDQLCKDTSSKTCKSWLNMRKIEKIPQKQSFVDRLLGSGSGMMIGGGIAIAAALGLFLAFRRK